MRILVLNDYLGETIKEMLTEAGLEAEMARDGDEAFRLYCEQGPLDIVLTDIDHPGMRAADLQKAILERILQTSYRLRSVPNPTETVLAARPSRTDR